MMTADVVTSEEIKVQLEAFRGPEGPTGPAGQQGDRGEAGYSPTVTVTNAELGHRVSIMDANGTKSFLVEDGYSPQVALNPKDDGVEIITTYREESTGLLGSDAQLIKHGQDYVLTEEDKQEIAANVLAALPTAEGGSY